MFEFIGNHSSQITVIFAVGAGVFAFIKWLDARNQELKDKRYERYVQHIHILSGSKDSKDVRISMTAQITLSSTS